MNEWLNLMSQFGLYFLGISFFIAVVWWVLCGIFQIFVQVTIFFVEMLRNRDN